MNAAEFMKTIYLGDRALKAIVIDAWNSEVKLQVDCISRVRGSEWDYYDKEDLVDGYLVFSGVTYFAIEPLGLIPNDLIRDIELNQRTCGDLFDATVSVASADSSGKFTEAQISICAKSISLEDVIDLGVRISS